MIRHSYLSLFDRDPDQVVELIAPVIRSARTTGSSVIIRRLPGPAAHHRLTPEEPPVPVEPGHLFREAWIDGVHQHYPGTPKPGYVTPWDYTPQWERDSATAVEQQIVDFVTVSGGTTAKFTREQRGQFEHEPSPPSSPDRRPCSICPGSGVDVRHHWQTSTARRCRRPQAGHSALGLPAVSLRWHDITRCGNTGDHTGRSRVEGSPLSRQTTVDYLVTATP
ncbi:MAG: hypothetical protein ABIQ18_36675 [Umezawaea sp.]